MVRWSGVAILLVISSGCSGLYFITDYYMDDGWPSGFGQVCGKSIEDDCFYLNSHLNSLGILKYVNDISCTVQLDAGKRHGARYKLEFKRFDLEYAESCTADSLTIYDSKMDETDLMAPMGEYCGDFKPNITGYPSQQYLTLRFKTDGSTGRKGYRILVTRTLPYPCYSDAFHCKAENRCIDGRLQCDGTPQCEDETDEHGCSFWEKLVGGFLALGLSSIVGIVVLIVTLCTGICVTVCCCTCCKKQCGCCKRCCKSIFKPCKSEVQKMKSAKVGNRPDEETVGRNEEVEIADETAEKSPYRTDDGMPTATTAPSPSSTVDDVSSKTPTARNVAEQPDGNVNGTSLRNESVSDGRGVIACVGSSQRASEIGVPKVDP